jgi:gliding motility-associated-like protein
MHIVASGGYILDSSILNYQKPEKLYSINGGMTFYQNDSLPGAIGSAMNNLAAGIYQIRVENINGCKAINHQNYTVTLIQPDSAYIDSVIVTPISCYNQTDGIIDVRAFGGNSLTYSIDSIQYFPNGLFNNLSSQAYFLEVIDLLGCPVTPNSQSDSIWVSEPMPLTVNPIVTQLLCYQDSTGLIELDIFGGNPNFTSYQFGYDIDWNVDTSSLSIPINSSYYLPKNDSIYGLIAGTYYANIIDYKGCGIVVPIVVNEPDPVEVNTITIVPVSCYGFGDGRILVNATGGNYLEYELTSSLGVTNPWQANPLFTGLTSDSTFISVRDSNACLVTYNTITKNYIPQPDSAFVDTIIARNILCFSDSTGSISVTAFGGNTLSYTIDSVFTSTKFYPGLAADTFYVQVVDSKSCPVNYMNNDSTVILTEPQLLVLESDLIQGVTCYYDTTGQIGHIITGGVAPYLLILNELDTLTSLTLTTQLFGGPWYFKAYDENGCTDSSLVYIPTTDYDCDSIPDDIEGNTDFDFDGIPNMMDFDSDGDGIADIIERDSNRDGILYDDCDNDGWPDYLDTDQCNFYVPDIITPNNDGDNDYFVIPDLDKYPNNRLNIFDRLGNLVYQQSSYVNTFNGIANRSSALSTTNGQLPIGTYFFILEVNGVPFQSGYIYIMR